MALFQVILDWLLMILILVGKIFYWLKLIKEDTSILMEMMKYLIANDVLSSVIILSHDIPSYFMTESLSKKFYALQILGTSAQCIPFFFALLMLPIFSLLSLIAIIAVYRFVTLKKSCISKTSIIFCYVGSMMLTAPLLTDYCGFVYYSDKHLWFYDFDKPYSLLFQKFNIGMQILCLSIVTVCMSLVLVYLAKRAKHFSSHSVQATGQTVRETTSVSSKMGTKGGGGPTTVTETLENGRGKLFQPPVVRSRSILDQGFAFIVLSLCFIMGTTAFNLLSHCESTLCLVVTVITGNLNRAKWIIYCFLMRQDATLSRILKRR